MSLKTKIYAALHYIVSGTAGLASPTSEYAPALTPLVLENGTGQDQASKVYTQDVNIAASGNTTLDLSGALTGSINEATVFTAVKAIYVEADADNVNDVVLGNGSNPLVGGPFGADGSQVVAVKPGGRFLWAAPKTGLTVTASTGDILKLANSSSGSAVNFKIIIVGI